MYEFTISLGSILSLWWFLVLCGQKSWSCVFPSHLSSLLPFLNDNTKEKKKATETSHKKFSEGKQLHVGMEASKTNQTRWEWHHNTFTPSLHLVPFCQLRTPQNSLHPIPYALNEQGTQLCSLHSLMHIKDDPYLPCSAAIKFHSIT